MRTPSVPWRFAAPRSPRGTSSALSMWAQPGSHAFRRAVGHAKEFAWPESDKCPWCGKALREHDEERCA